MKNDTRKKLIAMLLINSDPSTADDFKKTSDHLNGLSDDHLLEMKDIIQLLFRKELVEFDSGFKLMDFPSKKYFDELDAIALEHPDDIEIQKAIVRIKNMLK